MIDHTPAPWGITGNGADDWWIVPAEDAKKRGQVVRRIAVMQKPDFVYHMDTMHADAERLVYCVNEMAVLENLACDPNVSSEEIGIRIRNNLARR